MKMRHTFLYIAFLLFFGTAYSQESKTLFNGKDLSGWTIHGTEKWYVENGELICESGPDKEYGYLSTDQEYRNFVLDLSFKQEADGNSGVFIRSEIEGTRIEGWQVEVAPLNLHTGGIYESYGRGWLIKPNPKDENALLPNQWNHMSIRSVEGEITTWLNGRKMVNINDAKIGQGKGFIALQIHDGGGIKVRWKDIIIQELPASDNLFQSTIFTPVKGFTSGVEGPVVDKNGVLYAVNFARQGTIGKVTPAGESSVFIDLPNGSIANGIRFNSKGEMLIADYTNHNILKVDMVTEKLSVYAHESKMSQPNDIAIDDKDRLYASDPNWKESKGAIWRIDNDGKVTLLEGNMGTANGIEVSPDNKTLYVNESVQRKVWAYDLSSKGGISNKRILIEFSDFGMDGMRCDKDGNIYITRHGKGTVLKVSPTGDVIREIKLTGKNPSNLAFGGPDGRTVYVTLADQGNIETFRVDTPGRAFQSLK